MTLESAIETLTGVAGDAKALLEEIQSLADLGKDATTAQKNRIDKLVDKLDTASR